MAKTRDDSKQHTVRTANEIPQAANRVVGGVRYRVRAADLVVGAKLPVGESCLLACHEQSVR